MKSNPIRRSANLAAVFMACLAMARAEEEKDSHPAKIGEVKPEELAIPLPKPILNRLKLSELQAPEFRAEMRESLPGMDAEDINASENADVYRAADGVTFCCDHATMSLWIQRGNGWECLFQCLHVNKTFGGAPPHLPVRYLGNGFFAFSQTAPGGEEQRPEDKFPRARAITYLLDSRSGEIIARGEVFRYDHTPPVKVPPEWLARIGVKSPPEK